MEPIPALAARPAIDLGAVAETQRAALWASTARSLFPGVSVRTGRERPLVGHIQGAAFGAGALWRILSPAVSVQYTPSALAAASAEMFSVMLQLEGDISAAQNRRSCRLRPLEFCVIDGRSPFELEVTGHSSLFMFLQIPRGAVLSRHPYLEHRTAQTFDPQEAGVSLLRHMLLGLFESAPHLDDEQRNVALSAVTQLLGAPKVPPARGAEDVGWRVRAALACIDAELSDPELTASRVARSQGISRRHLDDILLKSIGTSVSAQIWSRRLSQVATDLLDPRFACRTVAQIAFAAGFKDVAHFTRAFKRRHHCTPSQWRLGARLSSTDRPG